MRAATISSVGLMTRLRNLGCIFINNMTGKPILVYTRAAPKRRLRKGELRAGANISGFNVALGWVMAELNTSTTSAVVIDPPEPDAPRKSERVPVNVATYVSIRRYSPGDGKAPSSWSWDCLDVLVRAGQKITIRGTAVLLQDLLDPRAHARKP